MAEFLPGERGMLERLLEMGGGYVLDFSDRTFSVFFDEYFKVNIDAETYRDGGTSKANRLRTFWAKEPDYLVGQVIEALIQHGHGAGCLNDEPGLIEDCRKIAQRLLRAHPVTEIDALAAIVEERDFEVVAQHVREAIDKNQPEGGLDRLHTFVVKYVRKLCQQRGVEVTREKPLHSMFGEYVKRLQAEGLLESEMTARIAKSSISVLEAFNDVRNNKSLAHDNPILNYEESLLIFNHIAALIRFLKALESKAESAAVFEAAQELSF